MRPHPFTLYGLALAAYVARPAASSPALALSGRHRIVPVSAIGWGMDRENTFAGSLSASLANTDHPYDYTDLMGMSALAFRTRWFRGPADQRWSGMSPIGEGDEEIAALRKATGWELRLPRLSHSKEEQRKLVVPLVTAAINAGQPVVSYNKKLDLGLICGYEDHGRTLLTYDYDHRAVPVKLSAAKLDPSFVLIPGRHSPPLPPRTAFLAALRAAVTNWHRGAVTMAPDRKLWYGDSAYARWAEDLGRVDGLSERNRKLLFQVSWWNLDSLYDARRRASMYLRRHASLLKPPTRPALERAAVLYGQEERETAATFMRRDVFLGPWTGKSITDWTPAVRQNEIALLKRVRDLDARAIDEIEAALRAEGQP